MAAWAIQIIESVLILAVFFRILASRTPTCGPALPVWLRTLAQRKTLCVMLVGGTVLALRIVLILLLGVPAPEWHDEFSYLLAADTFAHGRLTNAPHPLWQHFETFHVIQQPTYMSMYPPAQGLVLAAGEKLGNPWIGQLLMTAGLCSALCWMLQGWFAPGWALLGAVLAALRIGILSYWMNGYWSASVVALGGALVLGSFIRLKRRGGPLDAVWFATGLLVLANSRPYEGLLLSVPFVVALVAVMAKRGRRGLLPIVLPLAAVLMAGCAATGYYYYRVTGSPFRMTYVVNRSQYAMAPYFIWQSLRTAPVYRHAAMQTFYEWEVAQYAGYRDLAGFWLRTTDKFWAAWRFYLGPLLTVPLLASPWVVRDRRMRLVMISIGVLLAGTLVSTFFLPHYLAPGTGLLYIVLVQGMRHMSHWRWRGKRVGRRMILWLPALAAIMVGMRLTLIGLHSPLEPRWPRGNLERLRIELLLERLPGQQLVVVHYATTHNPDHEWVNNLADIDSQAIVWARDMGPGNAELLAYYPHRTVWRLNADETPMRLDPY